MRVILSLRGQSLQVLTSDLISSIENANNVSDTLKSLEESGELGRLFVKLNVNANARVNTRRIPIAVALLLLDNDTLSVRNAMKDAGFSDVLTQSVSFLLNFKRCNAGNVCQLTNDFAQVELSYEDLLEFACLSGIKDVEMVNSFDDCVKEKRKV